MSATANVSRGGEHATARRGGIDAWEIAFIDQKRARGFPDAAIANMLGRHVATVRGVSGVVVLAESHISIHTWPERDFAAVDIFMCGACDPHKAIPVLKAAFSPARIDVNEQRRGRVY